MNRFIKSKIHYYLILILVLCMVIPLARISYSENLYSNEWVTEGNNTYYYKEDGTLAKYWNKLKVSNNSDAKVKWCYFNKDGVLIKKVRLNTNNKWKTVNGKKFYFVKGHKPIRKGIPYYNYKYKTYVLVDISKQEYKFYKKKKLNQSGRVLTGKKGSPTPTGIYSVTQKVKNTRLYGPTWNYHVKRWIGFIGNEYGFHDASWKKDKYFENNKAYKKHGSHGCINMRLRDIKRLYNNVKIGTYVIIRK